MPSLQCAHSLDLCERKLRRSLWTTSINYLLYSHLCQLKFAHLNSKNAQFKCVACLHPKYMLRHVDQFCVAHWMIYNGCNACISLREVCRSSMNTCYVLMNERKKKSFKGWFDLHFAIDWPTTIFSSYSID